MASRSLLNQKPLMVIFEEIENPHHGSYYLPGEHLDSIVVDPRYPDRELVVGLLHEIAHYIYRDVGVDDDGNIGDELMHHRIEAFAQSATDLLLLSRPLVEAAVSA